MKKSILIFLVLSSSLIAFSQGTWSPRDTLPHDTNAMVQGLPGFSINGYGYVGIGEYGPYNTYFHSLWQFDPSTNTWTQKANFPGTARVSPACFVICDKAYVVCGSVKNFGTCVTECWEYDATTNIWTQKANFPGTARTYVVGFTIDSLGYVGTGANELSDFRKDFYAYHPSTNTWTRIADFGGIARSCDCGFAVNGKGYVCFGQDSTEKTLKDIWEYDPVANTWTQKSNSPGPGLLLPASFSICSNIYVGSGDSTAGALSADHRFWKYNTVTDSWAQEASVPGITKVAGGAFSIGDTGYYGFGTDSNTYAHNIFDKFYAGDNCPLVSNCISGTGIDNISLEYSISVYPNPNNGIFTIQPSLLTNDKWSVKIYNVTGEKVYDAVINEVEGDYKINLSNHPSGVYILSINMANQNFYKKIIIN